MIDATANSCVVLHITQHIRYGLTPLPFGTLPSAMSYMLEALGEMVGKYGLKALKGIS